MRLHRHQIEAQVPAFREPGVGGPSGPNSLPQIRRQLERICEALDVDYDDLAELYIAPGRVTALLYKRDSEGRLYRNEFNKVAVEQKRFPVDTITFVGDEGDI